MQVNCGGMIEPVAELVQTRNLVGNELLQNCCRPRQTNGKISNSKIEVWMSRRLVVNLTGNPINFPQFEKMSGRRSQNLDTPFVYDLDLQQTQTWASI